MSEEKKGNGLKNTAKIATAMVLKKTKLASIKLQLIIGGSLLLIVIIFVLVMGIISAVVGDGDESSKPLGVDMPPGQGKVSDDVLQYRDKVNEELMKFNLGEYTDLLLALMMQESGGKGLDPMQSSESYCGSVGCIQDPDLSIEKGVVHFSNVLNKSNGDIKLALQSYNFGGGFIDYVNERGGEYTFELAVEFSQMWYLRLAHTGLYTCLRAEAVKYSACYGDIMYVDSVLKYLPSSSGDTEIVQGDYKSPLKRDLYITSPFAWRDIGDGNEHHNGLDLACNAPDTIHAVKDGEVINARYTNGYGNYVLIKHSETEYTGYGHMSKLSVELGDQVEGGNEIGICGTTGRSTGEHLHFEIKTEPWGGFLNPQKYLGL